MKSVATFILKIEWVIYLLIALANWYSSRVGAVSLLLLIPLFASRWLIRRRLWTATLLDFAMLALVAIGILNWYTSPYHMTTLTVTAQPIFGIFLALGVIEYARSTGHLNAALYACAGLALIISLVAATTMQWHFDKSWQFEGLINLIPRWESSAFPLYVQFNPNVYSFIMVWLMPVSLAAWLVAKPHSLLRRLSLLSVCVVTVLVFLAQSRVVIAALLMSLTLFAVFVIPKGRIRVIVFGMIVLAGAFEAVIVTQVNAFENERAAEMRERDSGSFLARVLIWNKAMNIVDAYPWTGAGMDTFDLPRVRADYPIELPPLTHAHNLALQFLVDFGIPGLIAFCALLVVLVRMLFKVWRRGDAQLKVLAGGAACALLAYGITGLADMVRMFGRYAFIFWLLVGIIGGLYVLLDHNRSPHQLENAAPLDKFHRVGQ